MGCVALDKGRWATVDDEYVERVAHMPWFVEANGYAACVADGVILRMHRVIVGAKPHEIVDHINGDRLDNRRCNLRVCSNAQNQMNRTKPKTSARIASRYKGVTWDKCNGRWRAKIVVDGKQQHLGYFDSEIAAATAYDRAAVEHFGAFARTNEYVVDAEVEAILLDLPIEREPRRLVP